MFESKIIEVESLSMKEILDQICKGLIRYFGVQENDISLDTDLKELRDNDLLTFSPKNQLDDFLFKVESSYDIKFGYREIREINKLQDLLQLVNKKIREKDKKIRSH